MNSTERRRRERERRKRKRQKRNARILLAVLVLLVLVILGGAGLFIHGLIADHNAKAEKEASVSTEQADKGPRTITIGNVGDVIIHDPFLRSGEYKTEDGDYDFTSCFKFMKGLYEEQSFMVANLETTLAGKSRGYSGYPLFNSPDSLTDALHGSGVDLFLLANNHIYDTGKSGFLRTPKVLADRGYDHTGARYQDEEKKYIIEEIDGIKVGFINYTYETSGSGKCINGNPMDESVADKLNSFDPNHLDEFYEELGYQIALMRVSGARYIIFYPHWGEEYKLEAYGYTKEMAQKVCDLGVDAIIGGHPHVVEPVDVLTSSDGSHRTFVAYSMGNHLSNQRREMISSMPTGHTEDGIMVDLELTRDEKGSVSLTNVEVIPTWVYKKGQQEPTYYVIPLNDLKNVEKTTGLAGIKSDCKASSKRTHAIIDEGMEKVREAYGFE